MWYKNLGVKIYQQIRNRYIWGKCLEKCLIKFGILELSQYLTHDGNFWRLDSWTYYEYWLETRQDWIDELQTKENAS